MCFSVQGTATLRNRPRTSGTHSTALQPTQADGSEGEEKERDCNEAARTSSSFFIQKKTTPNERSYLSSTSNAPNLRKHGSGISLDPGYWLELLGPISEVDKDSTRSFLSPQANVF